jgi:hypothetical protein
VATLQLYRVKHFSNPSAVPADSRYPAPRRRKVNNI